MQGSKLHRCVRGASNGFVSAALQTCDLIVLRNPSNLTVLAGQRRRRLGGVVPLDHQAGGITRLVKGPMLPNPLTIPV